MMDGILCVNKPEGFTSFDVIAKLRGILQMKKIGHSGTLDPMATGVLPVFLGKGTKAISLLPTHDKEYTASFCIGLTTDTLDRTGIVLERFSGQATYQEVERELHKFEGELWQVPPMYSAVKKNGVPLYRLAREGKEIERMPRKVFVSKLSLVSFDERTQSGVFSIVCSAGTYVRSICDDLGKALHSGGILTDLVRTKACGFTLDDCLSLKEIEQMKQAGELTSAIRPIHSLFRDLPTLSLSGVAERMFSNGVPLDLKRLPSISGQVAVYGTDMFLGLASPVGEQLRIDKLFMESLKKE